MIFASHHPTEFRTLSDTRRVSVTVRPRKPAARGEILSESGDLLLLLYGTQSAAAICHPPCEEVRSCARVSATTTVRTPSGFANGKGVRRVL